MDDPKKTPAHLYSDGRWTPAQPQKEVFTPSNPFDTTLTSLGHELATTPDGWQECMTCCQRWHQRNRRDIIKIGPRPGVRLWELGKIPDIPAAVTSGSDFIFAGQTVHRTHNVAYKRGLVICLKYGALFLMAPG